jgi:Uma2 family endonuclease
MTHRTLPRAIVANAELRSLLRAEQIMSMPAIRPRRWTSAEVERLVDERQGLSPRYELVDGELLVTPAPSGRHQRLLLELAVRLREYVSRERIGEVRLGPCELKLETGQRFEPDLFVVPASAGRWPAANDASIRPLLICEALSPGSSRHDRLTKRRAFQRNNVPDYWVMDDDAQAFEVWHPADERAALIDERLVWHPDGASVAFELDVKEFFAAAADNAPLP